MLVSQLCKISRPGFTAATCCRQDRLNLVKAFSEQSAPENGLPASLGSLRMTATQMLEDMESHDLVIDRQVLLPIM